MRRKTSLEATFIQFSHPAIHMIVLIEESIIVSIDELRRALREVKVDARFFRCRINRQRILVEEFSQWAHRWGEKIVILTCKEIIAQVPMGHRFAYDGIVDAINGQLGIVRVTDIHRERLAALIAHETMHLLGARHCSSPDCLMSLTLRNGEFRYGLDSQGGNLYVCESCRSWL